MQLIDTLVQELICVRVYAAFMTTSYVRTVFETSRMHLRPCVKREVLTPCC